MSTEHLILCAIALAATSGLPGFFFPRRSHGGERIAVAALAGALVCVLTAIVQSRGNAHVGTVCIPALWHAMNAGWSMRVDALALFFLVPVVLIGFLGALYGLAYWPQRRHLRNGRLFRFFWGILVAGMIMLVTSAHALTLLFGWEMMALSAYFLISTEDHRAETRRASWIYLIATHAGTLCIFASFAVWRHITGSYLLTPLDTSATPAALTLFALLTFVGFGLKAGLMPLHFWLPGAHANAPSHVSAIMSGVVLKMGIYGIVRFASLIPHPPVTWGVALLLLGAISGVMGVLFALAQHDYKRLLAYHSVENIGIILIGLGVAMIGRATDANALLILGMAGCLLHVWNHSLFKALLFLSAGSVLHATGTRQIDVLGGLAKRMPWTAFCFVVGAIAICGLPPLNGFISEFFIYLGLAHGVAPDASRAAVLGTFIGIPALAMIGALAVACFVKVYGVMFLGEPRTDVAQRGHEAPWCMRIPMLVLVVVCTMIGIAPALFTPFLSNAIAAWSGTTFATSAHATLTHSTQPLTAPLLILALTLVYLFWRIRPALRAATRTVTWDCGYHAPTPRMQYTAESFAQMILRLFSRVVPQKVRRPHIFGLFPKTTHRHAHVDDTVLDGVLVPVSSKIERVLAMMHRIQNGASQEYLLYMLIALVLLLLTLIPFGRFLP